MLNKASTILLLVFLLVSFSVFSSNVELDRQVVSVGETFQIKVTGQKFDVSQLSIIQLESHFRIIAYGQESMHQIVNDGVTAHKKWIITFQAVEAGKFTLPKIKVDGVYSEPLVIQVKKLLDAKNKNRDIYLSGHVNPIKGVIGMDILYTLEVGVSSVAQQPQLSGLKNTPQFDVKTITGGTSFSRVLNGKHYDVWKKRYILTPKLSGQLHFPRFNLAAYVPTQGRPVKSDPFALVNFSLVTRGANLRPVQVQSKPLSVSVSPAKPIKGNWIPAMGIKINSKWQGSLDNWHAGEPRTRHIEIVANGTSLNQLPEIDMGSKEMTSYPEKQKFEQLIVGASIVSKTTRNIVIVPLHAGQINIPGLELTWWDVSKQLFSTTSLPAEKITILPAIVISTSPSSAVSSPSDSVVGFSRSGWIHAFVLYGPWFGLILLVIFVLCWLKKIKKTPASTMLVGSIKKNDCKSYMKALEKACLSKSPVAINQALIQWGRVFYNANDLSGLETLSRHVTNPSLTPLLGQLSRQIWSSEPGEFDHADELFQIISLLVEKKTSKNSVDSKNKIPPLY